jgi:hypothetical protein
MLTKAKVSLVVQFLDVSTRLRANQEMEKADAGCFQQKKRRTVPILRAEMNSQTFSHS